MTRTITIGKLVIKSNVSGRRFRYVQNVVNKFVKENPEHSGVLANNAKISGQKARNALNSLNAAIAGSSLTFRIMYNRTVVVESQESTENEYMGVTYRVKTGDTWNTIQNRVSRARNQYFEPGTIRKINGNKRLLAGDTIVLPAVRIITCKSKTRNREFIGEEYRVRVGDTVKNIFDRLVALRCDSSITMKSFLRLNHLPESILAPYMPLPPVLKLPKPKSVTTTSKKGKAFIKKEEGEVPYIYNDTFKRCLIDSIPVKKEGKYAFFFDEHQTGNATIGIGHKHHDGPATLSKDKDFLQEQEDHWVIKPIPQKTMASMIERWFQEDIRSAEIEVNNITIPLNQNQFDALVSLTFNRKEYFRKLKPLLEKCDYKGATDKWRKFAHKARRDNEIAIFLTKV